MPSCILTDFLAPGSEQERLNMISRAFERLPPDELERFVEYVTDCRAFTFVDSDKLCFVAIDVTLLAYNQYHRL